MPVQSQKGDIIDGKGQSMVQECGMQKKFPLPSITQNMKDIYNIAEKSPQHFKGSPMTMRAVINHSLTRVAHTVSDHHLHRE
jgi:hypothetical protein